MTAAYDTYDYPAYWLGREYESKAEILAIKELLAKIPKIKTILEAGAGFGRLTPTYLYRAKKVILVDPSSKLLNLARKNLKEEKIKFIQSKIENIEGKIRLASIDLILIVRVLHHVEDLDKVFTITSKLLKDEGYLLIEFPNKRHIKATLTEFLRGNLTYPLDIFPKEVKGKKNKTQKCLPFTNYHPDVIKHKLENGGFKILEKRSVSNIRSPFIKKILTTETLIFLEKYLQKPLAYINFGPSIFILAKKQDK